MAFPTIDVANIGWMASLIATIKTGLLWFAKTSSFLAHKVVAFFAASRIACTAAFIALVVTILTAAGVCFQFLIGQALSFAAPAIPHPNNEFVRGAFQLADNVIPFDFLADIFDFFLGFYSVYLIVCRTRIVFRWTVRAYDYLTKSVK